MTFPRAAPADIVAEYERREAAAGGLERSDPRALAEEVAAALGLPYATVREALLDHWVQGAC